jgi:sortase B
MRRLGIVFFTLVSVCCFAYAAVWHFGNQSRQRADTGLADTFHTQRVLAQGNAPATEAEGGVYNASDGAVYDAPTHGDIDPFEALRGINPDIIGWITVGGTRIDYPVVRGRDNDYYLVNDIYGERSRAGAIFMDYRSMADSPVRVIYGHHMKDGSMFGDLFKFLQPHFMEKHPYIILYGADGGYEVFRIAEVRYWDETDTGERALHDYLDTWASRYPGVPALCLITCDNSPHNLHLLVVAMRT